ncbi:calcineurin-like phosphoesterase C-terminal domain-containing protein [Flagellimonas marinaquae]|uniref:calcineurin-like phosphoesterase C-terminal domain-containing protein n=1 Tax=Flagellimonas marinaquae TaxID=254955 RepID=UPI0020762EE1|nr:calcineurin-like phosphoesterase family protein [Allomuricauda aquimarina]USD26069.1 calcineurin-like phosphoesterase family protein [Allomuricauda aquimarina]
MKRSTVLVILFLVQSLTAQDWQQVNGKVFLDANGNNSMDAREKGIRDVWVSNGDTFVQTDKNGSYTILVKPGQILFPILPSKYHYTETDKWWHSFFEETDTSGKFNFGLVEQQTKKRFKVLAVGDIQVGDTTEMLQAGNSVLRELVNRKDYDMSIYLGDLVNDVPTLFQPLKTMMNGNQIPMWTVYGNHDRDFSVAPQKQPNAYNRHFGPDTYAFFKNEVLFIILNSIYPEGKFGYNGIYDEHQLNFLRNILAEIEHDRPIVIAQHIPLVGMENKNDVVQLLDPFKKVLFLSGHTHTVFRNYITTPSGNTIHELTAGAVSGHWWTGQRSWEGVPLALMHCGTPKGYFEVEFNEGDYVVNYKGVGLPKTKQMSVWLGDYNDAPTSFLSKDDNIYINVYVGSDSTAIDLDINGLPVVKVEKVNELDPFVAYIKRMQKEGGTPDNLSKKSPYLRKKSNHLWKAQLPFGLKRGIHKLRIRVKDNKVRPFTEDVWFWKK